MSGDWLQSPAAGKDGGAKIKQEHVADEICCRSEGEVLIFIGVQFVCRTEETISWQAILGSRRRRTHNPREAGPSQRAGRRAYEPQQLGSSHRAERSEVAHPANRIPGGAASGP
jgi:hypothetical protein